MESRNEHLAYIFTKSKETRKKFEFYMMGIGLFSDFENTYDNKEKIIKEEKNET